jgi:hypothetical protein
MRKINIAHRKAVRNNTPQNWAQFRLRWNKFKTLFGEPNSDRMKIEERKLKMNHIAVKFGGS